MDQLNNTEFLNKVNQNKEKESVSVIVETSEGKTAFMSFIAVIYGAAMLLSSIFWYIIFALSSGATWALYCGISIDLVILQAIFATNPSVVLFKKTRLFLPIIYCIVLISISN